MAARPSAAGRVILDTVQIRRLQAVVYWVKDHDKRGLVAQLDLWDNKTMIEAMLCFDEWLRKDTYWADHNAEVTKAIVSVPLHSSCI